MCESIGMWYGTFHGICCITPISMWPMLIQSINISTDNITDDSLSAVNQIWLLSTPLQGMISIKLSIYHASSVVLCSQILLNRVRNCSKIISNEMRIVSKTMSEIDWGITMTSDKYRIMNVLEWRTVYALIRGLFWCSFSELRSNLGNKHQNNTWVNAWTVRYETAYIISFLTWYDQSTNDDKMTIFKHWFTFCWWCHNRLLMMSQWAGNCDVITWIMISNSLDINFIHGDIHGRSCKNVLLHPTELWTISTTKSSMLTPHKMMNMNFHRV